MSEAKRAEILAGLGKLVKSLDEAIIEYIVGIVEGLEPGQTGADLFDQISPFIQSSDCKVSDAELLKICENIVQSLHAKSPKAKNQENMVLLNSPVNLAELSKKMEENQISLFSEKERRLPSSDGKLREAALKQQQQRDKRAKKDADKVVVSKETGPSKESFGVIQRSTNPNNLKLSRDILIENIDLNFGATELLKGASLSLSFGRRYGLVGRNGAGKSSLLRALANRELSFPAHIQILHVEQEVVGDDTTALESVLESDIERTMLLREEKEILNRMNAAPAAAPAPVENGSNGTTANENKGAQQDKPTKGKTTDDARLAQIYARLGEIEADKAEAKASTILAGLGFSSEGQKAPTKSYSGGWRMRIALARALFCEPDLLLLDEPTNMLDVKTILWLERYLLKWKKTLLVVSHAREFLNNIATDIIHLHSKVLNPYKGNYDQFEKTRNERLLNQTKAFESQQVQRAHIQKFIDRFRYNAKRASLAQSRIKYLNKMELVPEVLEDPTFGFEFPVPENLSPPIIDFNDVYFQYSPQSKLLFDKLSFGVDMDSRVAIVGVNGSGKSTLIKLLVGELAATKGYIFRHSRLRLGRFSQHHVDQLRLDMTGVEYLASLFPGKDSQYYRAALGKYGISGTLPLQLISSLSGGQKSRVVFAVLGLLRPHVLVMDEPTNHLDIETVEVLARALITFEGGVVLVTHDERLITLVCNELWLCEGNGKITVFEGDYEAYKRSLGIDV